MGKGTYIYFEEYESEVVAMLFRGFLLVAAVAVLCGRAEGLTHSPLFRGLRVSTPPFVVSSSGASAGFTPHATPIALDTTHADTPGVPASGPTGGRIQNFAKGVTAKVAAFLGKADSIFTNILERITKDADTSNVIKSTLYTVAVVCATISVLSSVGLDTKPLLSLFTVVSLTFGLAFKKMLGDLFSSAYILAMRPFKRGDLITVDGKWGGKVVSVDMNYVKLEKADGSELLVPTASVYGKSVQFDKKK